MKTYFQIKDNILDKRLGMIINQRDFVENRKQIHNKIQELLEFYSSNFTL